MTIARRIMNLTGTEWCGNKQVPTPEPLYSISGGRKTRFHRGHDAQYDRDRDLVHVFTTNNDSFELWIGHPNRWLFHCRRKEARRLAVYILWDWWIRTEWFGLRRWAYYRALRVEVQRHKRLMVEARRPTDLLDQ